MNQRNKALKIIREVLTENLLAIQKIILFGSHARGNYNAGSDLDFLVVLTHNIPIKVKHKMIIEIKRRLAKLRIPNDIIIQSNERFNSMKKSPGNIAYTASLEGMVL